VNPGDGKILQGNSSKGRTASRHARHFRILCLLAGQCASERNSVNLSIETPAFTPPDSPDLNPVDYKVWSLLWEQVFKVKVNKVYELRQCIQAV